MTDAGKTENYVRIEVMDKKGGLKALKTLFELCQPRESVFDETKRDDVLDLTDLAENRIDPHRFFEENFLTEGMKVLFETAFKRFHRRSETGIIKLTQSMGGGKTHNMIALGLLAKYPEFRQKVLGDGFKDSPLGKIRVVAFTGRGLSIILCKPHFPLRDLI